MISLRLSFNEKKVDGSKNDTVHMFYKHKHYVSAYVHKVFPSSLSFPSNQQSQSMKEIKVNACSEINNKQNYLPSYFFFEFGIRNNMSEE